MENKFMIFENKNFKEFNPVSIGESKFKKNAFFNSYSKKTYFFHYVYDGKGTFVCDEKEYKMEQGRLFITLNNQKVKHISDGEAPLHIIWVEFIGEYAQRLKQISYPLVDYQENTFFELRKVFELKGFQEEFVSGKLLEAFSFLFQGEKTLLNYHSKVKNYIDINYMDTNLNIQNIASIIGLNKRYMTRIFKKTQGVTIIDYIIEKRMNKACELLKKGNPVGIVASKVGYSDPYHFSKMFKTVHGISPKDYKNQFCDQ